jgi:hypothetical protein
MKLRKMIMALAMFGMVSSAFAGYNDVGGEIQHLMVMANGEIIVKLKNVDNLNNTNETNCSTSLNAGYFTIKPTASTEIKNRMYSYLLAARMSGIPITLSYGYNLPCVSNYATIEKIR